MSAVREWAASQGGNFKTVSAFNPTCITVREKPN